MQKPGNSIGRMLIRDALRRKSRLRGVDRHTAFFSVRLGFAGYEKPDIGRLRWFGGASVNFLVLVRAGRRILSPTSGGR
jgi:hypothetical protein